MPFTVIDHTADWGIRVRAPDLPSLFSEACRGMFAQITDWQRIGTESRRRLRIEGVDETDLLINTLRELLYLFAGKAMLVKELRIDTIEGCVLTGKALGERFNPDKHPLHTEIKAATYAGGEIEKNRQGYSVTVIFDV